MEYKRIDNKCIIRIDKGDEVIEKLMEICKKEKIELGTITGIGATDNLQIGLFDIYTKEYISNTLEGVYEITSLMGNITTKENQVYLHIHINVSDRSNKTYGGHLNKCVVSATSEIFIDIIPSNVNRKLNSEIGLNLMEFNSEDR